MKKIFFISLATSLMLAATLSDTDIGLRKHSLNDEQKLEIKNFHYSEFEAGESQRFERAFFNAPPQIPHNVEEFLPITQEENSCLGCHDQGNDIERVELETGEPTPMPKSHFYDFREHKSLDEVSQARYNCVQCHAPQANISSGVKNTFEPDFRGDKLNSKRSNLLDVLNDGLDDEALK